MNNDNLTGSIKILLFAFLLLSGLYFAKVFLIPVTISALFAMLVLPVTEKLESFNVPRGLSSFFGLLTIILILSILGYILISQLSRFSEDLPHMEYQLNNRFREVKKLIEDLTGIPKEDQRSFINDNLSNMAGSIGLYIRRVLAFTAEAAIFLLLLSFYTFFFLYFRGKFNKFILMILPSALHKRAAVVIIQTSKTINSYLVGVLGVVAVLTILNTIGLLIIGIPHAFFLGFLAGLLNIIPFIGSFTGSLIPIFIALLTKDSIWYAVAVAALFTINQTIESYLLTPNITGSQVKMNPLATLMALIIGGLLWGIPGMVLFIPMLGVTKVVLEHITQTKPYSYLLSDEE
jgi:predicted PurR-regulated permease PerM